MENKLLYIISLVVIIAGIIMTATLGFNYGLEYGDYTRINVYMTEGNAIDGVTAIAEESFNGKYDIAYTDDFKDTVSIKAKGISEEQITELKNRLVEKYAFEDEENSISVINTPKVEIYDLIKDYIMPVIISFVIVLIYIAISYRKIGIVKSLAMPCVSVIMINALYVSFLAICRITINEYTIPIGIFIYVMSILGTIIILNNKMMEAE